MLGPVVGDMDHVDCGPHEMAVSGWRFDNLNVHNLKVGFCKYLP